MTKNARHDGSKKKASPRGKRKLEFIDKKKARTPLSGKLIFLDVKVLKAKKRLEDDIKRLGAVVEPFLSKDINYLITSNPPAKPVGSDNGSAGSPSVSTPSPFNMGPSPVATEGVQKSNPNVYRGKAIYHKAKINAQSNQNNTVVDNAQRLGVKIVGLDAAQKWIQKEIMKLPQPDQKHEKKETSSTNKRSLQVKKLKGPFVKFEDGSLQYRAVYQHIETWPHINIDTPKGTCPFDGTRVGKDEESMGDRQDKIGIAKAETNSDGEEHGDSHTPAKGKCKKSDSIIGPVRIMTAGEIRRRAERKKLMEKKRGYCECCMVKYENIDMHIRDEQHRNFVKNKRNYECLDVLIKTGTNCNTAKFLQRTLNQHLRKGKTSCDDVDVAIPENKQWTPRKTAAAKLLAKTKRHQNESNKQKSFVKSPKENTNENRSNDGPANNAMSRTKSPSAKSVNFSSKTKKVGGLSRIDCDSGSGAVLITDQDEKLQVNSQVQVRLLELNMNSAAVQSNLKGDADLVFQNNRTNCRNKKPENFANCEECSQGTHNQERASRSKNIKANESIHKENIPQASIDVDVCCAKDIIQGENLNDNACPKKVGNKVKDFNKGYTELPNSECVKNDSTEVDNLRIKSEIAQGSLIKSKQLMSPRKQTKSKSKGSKSKHHKCQVENIVEEAVKNQPEHMDIDYIPLGFSNQGQVNEKSTALKKNTNVVDTGKENIQTIGYDNNSSLKDDMNITSSNARNKVMEKVRDLDIPVQLNHEKNTEENDDFDNHYVPKMSKSKYKDRNFSPNRIDWGEENLVKTNDAKVIVKRWSQKLTTNSSKCSIQDNNHNTSRSISHNHKIPEDDLDCMETDSNNIKHSDCGQKIDFDKKNKCREVLNNLTIKYCDESTVYMKLSREEAVKLSPKGSNSATGRKSKPKNKKTGDVYDFTDSNSPERNNSMQQKLNQKSTQRGVSEDLHNLPEMKKDEYELSSDVSLIAAESPKLNRKTRTPNSTKRNKVVDTPQSGYSSTPRSNPRKMWRERNWTEKCLNPCPASSNSSGKKLVKLKLPVKSQTNTKVVNEKDTASKNSLRKDSGNRRDTGTKLSHDDSQGGKYSKVKSCHQKDTKSVSSNVAVTSINKEFCQERENKRKKNHKKQKISTVTSVQNSHCSSPIPKSLMQTLQKRNLSHSPSSKFCAKNKTDAIQRLSPTKPFKQMKMTQNASLKQTTPKKSIDKPSKRKSPRKGKSPGRKLFWRSVNFGSKKCKKVKLNKSWSLLSDRSMGKLLESDSEMDDDCFEGFTQEEILAGSSLGSDASYVETTEIDLDENSREEWVMDVDIVTENEDSNQGFNIHDLVPVFSSPWKRSDSSWDDACESYIKSQVSINTSHSKSMHECFSSPSKMIPSPRKRKRLASVQEAQSPRTPKHRRKRIRLDQNCIERVDKDIVFNHLSPQKLNSSVIVISSSPLKAVNTSTPFRGIFNLDREEEEVVKKKSKSSKNSNKMKCTVTVSKSAKTSKGKPQSRHSKSSV